MCLEGTCIWQFKYFMHTSVCIVTVPFRRCNGSLGIISSINVNNNKFQMSFVVNIPANLDFHYEL